MAKLVLPARLRAYLYPEEIALVPVDELERVFRRALEHLRDETGQPVGDYLEFGVFRGERRRARS